MAASGLEARLRPGRALLFSVIGALCLWGRAVLLRALPAMGDTFLAALAIGAGLLAMGAFCLWMVLRLGAGLRPGIVLDERGLDHRLLGFVPWAETEAVEMTRVGPRCMFYVRPSSIESVRRHGLTRFWPRRPGGDLLFPIEAFDLPPETVVATARALREEAIEALAPLDRPRSEQERGVMSQLEALAEAGAPMSEVEAVLVASRDRMVATLAKEYELRLAARKRRSRWANAILAVLLGAGAGFALYLWIFVING